MTPRTLPAKWDKSMILQNQIDPAVKFEGPSRDTGGMKAYPFFYGFTRFPYQQGIADPTTGVYSITGASAEGPDGIAITAGGSLNIPIVLDDDENFHLLYIKYGAFRVNEFMTAADGTADTLGQSLGDLIGQYDQILLTNIGEATGLTVGQLYYPVTIGAASFQLSLTAGGAAINFVGGGTFTWQRVQPAIGSREYLLYPYQPGSGGTFANTLLNAGVNTRIPYWTELDVSAYMVSSGARDLYGGFQRQPILGATEEAPIPMLDLQSSKDGLGMVKTPFQLTKSATVNLRVSSRSAYPLHVYGHLFGYKVTL